MLLAIFTALIFLGLALLVLLNSTYTTSFNLFGKIYEQVPVILVILISFFTGICYTIVFYLYGKARKFSKNRRKQKEERLTASVKEQTKEPQPPI